MSVFDLVPVDGRDRVHLPPGQTVLGRGPLLDISDKRVSRHHGLMENLNGQLRLKPTHVNPCFIQSSLSDDPQPLEKGSWFQLHNGDLFSLLPGQFIYRVEAVGGEERTPRNSQNLEEEDEYGLSVSAEPDIEAPPDVGLKQKPTSSPSASMNEADRCFRQDDLIRPMEDIQTTMVLSEQRRRVLPAWMITAASTSNLKAVKRSKQQTAVQATPTPTSLLEEAELSVEEEERMRRKKRSKMNNKEEKQETETDDPPASGSKVSRKGNASSQTSNSDVAEDSKLSNGSEEEDRKSSDDCKVDDRRSSNDSEEEKDTKSSDRRVRTPCPYGMDCYRKNPLHFQEFCHPGDTDHQEDQDRPECPYGTNCYRKNPLHRKQFRHTQEAARSTQTKRIPDEDEDSGDEDSEDIDEDSDYVPLNSEDSEQEVFLKKRK